MNDWLKNSWSNLASRYTGNHILIDEYWQEIKSKYSSKNRYYHNLMHIYNLLKQAEEKAKHIVDFDSLLFAIWYHDIIYKSIRRTNEEKSAELALNRLKLIDFDKERLNSVEKLIVSTKNHQILLSQNEDNAYFLDFDLSIFGTDWNSYQAYLKKIRKEYAIYPDFLYNKGRKKILLNFLERDNLYFTEYYKNKFESQARKNIKKEIELL